VADGKPVPVGEGASVSVRGRADDGRLVGALRPSSSPVVSPGSPSYGNAGDLVAGLSVGTSRESKEAISSAAISRGESLTPLLKPFLVSPPLLAAKYPAPPPATMAANAAKSAVT
jgi:hypothetical protein